MLVPGDYYWITWTSSKESPKIGKSWNSLRKFLKRLRPGACWIYCITSEGNGVIHMILRLGKGESRLDIDVLREHWINLHKANQIKIKRVGKDPEKLIAYISDQRKKGLAGEVAWQDKMVRWHWSKGWIPTGFTKQFGKFWYESFLAGLDDITRTDLLRDWLLSVRNDPSYLKARPYIDENATWHYSELKNEIGSKSTFR
jgi:hypothetical protein